MINWALVVMHNYHFISLISSLRGAAAALYKARAAEPRDAGAGAERLLLVYASSGLVGRRKQIARFLLLAAAVTASGWTQLSDSGGRLACGSEHFEVPDPTMTRRA
jgi:hypothetical protein